MSERARLTLIFWLLMLRYNPDADQDERAERFGVCQKTIGQALKKLNVT
ncbi:MAG: hypothetical protein HRT36_02775 [Alphaproteobacteria bacterium]|nr:hypothetical protein [Alphaproteobacteria bacterium]